MAPDTIDIIAISGSLRRGSLNSALLRAAAALPSAGWSLRLAGIAGIPLYDGDLEEAEGIPHAVARLKDQIAAADGLLLATPEYNNSIPGVLKNAVDWLSRPPDDTGALVDEATRRRLADHLDGFAAFVRRHRRR